MKSLVILLFLSIPAFTYSLKLRGSTSLQSQVPAGISQNCSDYIEYLNTTTPENRVESLQNTDLYSGKGINDLGDMWGCNANEGFRFTSLYVNASAFLGLCFSKNCSDDDLNYYSPQIIAALNQTLIDNDQKPLFQFSLYALNPNTFAPQLDWVYFAILFTVIFVVLMSFVDPLMRKVSKNPDRATNKWVKCFSITDNWKKMMTVRNNDKSLAVYNAIRVLSFLQVVYGHEYFNHIILASNVPNLGTSVLQSYYALFVFSCLYSVDNFFYLSGFVLGYVIVDKKRLGQLQFRKPMGYVGALMHRLFRLWPCFIFAIFIYWKLCNNIYDAPAWIGFTRTTETCDKDWWRQILFIGIFGEGHAACFGWGWYMQSEWWVFMYSMILVMVMSENRRLGKLLIFLSLVASQTYVYVLFFQKKYGVNISFASLGGDFFQDFYSKPWTRSPPYFFGLLVGIIYKQWRLKKKQLQHSVEVVSHGNASSKGQVKQAEHSLSSTYFNSVAKFASGPAKWGIYAFSIGMLFAMIYGPRPVELDWNAWSTGFNSFYGASSRLAWVFFVFLVSLPGLSGSQDILVRFMASDFFAWFANITFTGYLVHYMILQGSTFGQQDATYIGFEEMNQYFAVELPITIVAAILMSLFIEKPFQNIQALVFSRKHDDKKEAEQPLINQKVNPQKQQQAHD